jgi:CRP/FNR family transcriptional regulator, cyclic AMP receptor protein
MEWRLLASLEADDRREVMKVCTRRKFRKGDTVFHAGDPGDTLHFIVSGHAAVRVSTPLGDVATLTVLGPGESFGELALVGSTPVRSASIVAHDALETMALHRRDFDELCRSFPRARELLIEVLVEQVRRLSGQVLDALYVPADKRVLRRLRDLVELYRGEGPTASIPVTQEDLASMAGTTRPTANRTLQELVADGTLELGRGRIDVLDIERITKLAR